MARPVIALLTDFGLHDHYVGVMKAVMLGLARSSSKPWSATCLLAQSSSGSSTPASDRNGAVLPWRQVG